MLGHLWLNLLHVLFQDQVANLTVSRSVQSLQLLSVTSVGELLDILLYREGRSLASLFILINETGQLLQIRTFRALTFWEMDSIWVWRLSIMRFCSCTIFCLSSDCCFKAEFLHWSVFRDCSTDWNSCMSCAISVSTVVSSFSSDNSIVSSCKLRSVAYNSRISVKGLYFLLPVCDLVIQRLRHFN